MSSNLDDQPTGPASQSAFRFLVALSFAGDDKRDEIREIAMILRERLGADRVFFDEFFQSELAGLDADTYLQDIYLNQTLMVVSCICERYDEKPWTQDEWRAIRAFERTKCRTKATRARFFPLRFGDGEVVGIYSNAIVPDVRNESPEAIADLICDRLKVLDVKAASTISTRLGIWPRWLKSIPLLKYGLIVAGVILCGLIVWQVLSKPTLDDPTNLPDPFSVFPDAPTAEKAKAAGPALAANERFVIQYRNLTKTDLVLLLLDFKAHFDGRVGWREIPVTANSQQFEEYRRLFNGPGWYGVAVRLPSKKIVGLGCRNFPSGDPLKWRLTLMDDEQSIFIDEWRQ